MPAALPAALASYGNAANLEVPTALRRGEWPPVAKPEPLQAPSPLVMLLEAHVHLELATKHCNRSPDAILMRHVDHAFALVDALYQGQRV